MSIYNSLCYTGKVYEVIFVNNVDFNVHWEKSEISFSVLILQSGELHKLLLLD